MAYYKIGNQILSEEEYDAQNLAVWRFVLFVMGAVVAGLFLLSTYPEELPKMWSFVCTVTAGIGVGGLMTMFAAYIRAGMSLLVLIVLMCAVIYLVWLVV